MAKKVRAQSSGSKSSARSKSPRSPAAAPKDRIVDAFMGLLSTHDFAGIGLVDIAEAAGMSLGELREHCNGKYAILTDFSRRIDRIVLDGGPAEGETARDRLFEILMRRFDALEPYKNAIRATHRAMRCDPCLMGLLHRNASRSQKWMMHAAGAEKSGLLGVAAVKGLVAVNAETLRVWLDDDDPGLAKTMAVLDRGLARGARALKIADCLCSRLDAFVRRDRATRPDPVKT